MKRNFVYLFLRELKSRRKLISLLGIKNTILLSWLKSKIAKEKNKEKLWDLWNSKHEIILTYLSKYLSQYRNVEYHGCKGVKKDVPSDTIWVFWWQGEESMPEVVSVCYKKLIKYSNSHPVTLLTSSNINDYLDIPDVILKKIGKELTFTAFSDYVRLNLLAIYGGLWIDSTFYLTKPIDTDIFNYPFFSIKNEPNDNQYVCKYRWAVNFMYVAQNSLYMRNIRNMFATYWETHNVSMDYLLMDYCFELESRLNSDFNEMLNNLPITNIDSHEIRINFNEPFNANKWKKWLSTTTCFKLSYKGELKKNVDGELTFYGYVVDNKE